MATIINTPGSDNGGNGSAAGWVIAVIILILIILFGIFVWPGINGGNAVTPAPTTTNAPAATTPNGLGGVLNVTSTTTSNTATSTPITSTTTTTTVTPL